MYEQGSGDQLRGGEKVKMKPEGFWCWLECSLRASETWKFAVKLFDLMMVMVIPDRNRWEKRRVRMIRDDW